MGKLGSDMEFEKYLKLEMYVFIFTVSIKVAPKETVAAIMILYRNTKVKVRSPDGDTEYFGVEDAMRSSFRRRNG